MVGSVKYTVYQFVAVVVEVVGVYVSCGLIPGVQALVIMIMAKREKVVLINGWEVVSYIGNSTFNKIIA